MSSKRNLWKKNWVMSSLFLVAVLGGSVVLSERAAAMLGQNRVQQDGGGYDYTEDAPAEDLPDENVGTITTNNNDIVTVETRFVTNGSSAAGYRTFTAQVTDTLWYAWNRGINGTLYPSSDNAISGWVEGLADPNITIGYDFGVYDSAGVNRIAEGSTITQGTQVMLKFSPYVSDNIFWFGTGYSMDSPYGEWRANAAAPSRQSNRVTCDAKDLTQQYSLSLGTVSEIFDVYVPFMVHPPTRTLTNLTGFSCGTLTANGDGSQSALCTATGIGSVAPTFSYEDTYGKFYYRYYDYRDMTGLGWGGPGCYGNNIPMSNSSSTSDPYTINIPSQSFVYPITISVGNNPPTPPTMVCPASVAVGQDIPVSLTSSDPDGDQVRYGVGWYSSTTPDSGWTSFMNSGTTGSLTKVGGYSAGGAYTIYGWAQDSNSANSSASSCVVNVVANPAPVVDLKINGSDGPLAILRNANLNITWTNVANATSCTGTDLGGAWNGPKAITGGSDNMSATAANDFTLSCTGPGGTTIDTVSVTLQPTLKICPGNSCDGGAQALSSLTLNKGNSTQVVACYNDATGCNSSVPGVNATWTGATSTVTSSNTNPNTITGVDTSSVRLNASYSGQNAPLDVNVICNDPGACDRDPQSQSLCATDTFTVRDTCNNTITCNGSKSCDYNWKEVAPN